MKLRTMVALASLLALVAGPAATARTEDSLLDPFLEYYILAMGPCDMLEPACRLACEVLNTQKLASDPLFVLFGCIHKRP